MPTPPISDDKVLEAVQAVEALGSQSAAAEFLHIARSTLQGRLKRAAERGLLPLDPVMPGFAIKSVASKTADGAWVKQVKEAGEAYATPPGMIIKKRSVLAGADNRVLLTWNKEDTAAQATIDIMKSALDAFKEEIPRLPALLGPTYVRDDLLNQFVVTDNHFGMLSWREETGADYDLRIAEQLLLDWFAAAIAQAPDAHTAILAQLGDLMHHDALESVTPAHRHVLDADSRLQKVIRVVIRTIRRIIDMLLQSHQHVHVVMASGNHDPASSAWLREMLATMYEDEPRISVDNSPSLYYAYEWGQTGLYYHHMHKRGVKDIDRTFAGMFREMFGRCRYNYGHGGHRHSDEVVETPLMIVERHQTLAAPDAHSAGGGWLSGRSAKRVTYSRQFGEVGRDVLRPEMVLGASRFQAANDNDERKEMAA